MSVSPRPVIVVEDDPFTRLIQIVLDPDTSADRRAAFADFMEHDEPDFTGWCDRVRRQASRLVPAEVRMVDTPAAMLAALPDAQAVVVESFPIGRAELAAAPHLRIVQKFGALLRNVDTAACADRGITVRTLRRRANIACAEQAFALMLALAKMIPRLNGMISVEQLEAAGHAFRPFDRHHTPNGNWGRIPGMRMLNGTTIGIIGLGEIGQEIAQRAGVFGMRTLYFQRTRLVEAEERALRAEYVPLDELLAESDWIVPQVPGGEATRGLLGREQFARVKQGACIVNVSGAAVVDRAALIEALNAGSAVSRSTRFTKSRAAATMNCCGSTM